jgi:hypothetical protein
MKTQPSEGFTRFCAKSASSLETPAAASSAAHRSISSSKRRISASDVFADKYAHSGAGIGTSFCVNAFSFARAISGVRAVYE